MTEYIAERGCWVDRPELRRFGGPSNHGPHAYHLGWFRKVHYHCPGMTEMPDMFLTREAQELRRIRKALEALVNGG